MKELMFLEDKTVRSKNLDRIGILEKVGNLLLLSNNEHATTKQISDFFETPKKTIESLFADNKEEIEMSGAFFLQGIDLKDFKTNLPNPGDLKRVPSCWLFPKRAILNIGMLLRDSEVAKRLREALLDVVEAAPEAIKKVTKLIATTTFCLSAIYTICISFKLISTKTTFI
jgi:hypothetical protein